MATDTCTCGHGRFAHEHYRTGSDCSECDCPKYRQQRAGTSIRYRIVRVGRVDTPFATAVADTIAVRVSDQGAELDYTAHVDGIVMSATIHLRPGDRIEAAGHVRSGS